MSKKRVYEVARELDVSSKELLELASEIGYEYSSHMASMEEEEIRKISESLKGGNSEEVVEKPAVEESTQKQAKKDKNENKKKYQNDHNKKGRNQAPAASQPSKKQAEANDNVLEYTEGMTIADIAKATGKDSASLVKSLFMMGMMVNQNQSLDSDTIAILADEMGMEAVQVFNFDVADFDGYFSHEYAEEELSERPPVVTIMGHVDHGKTTLLDTLRDARVTEGEAGGITQHIGAYQLVANGKPITFLDTPGHAAFTTMRARGADVTDIAIIVVAADDGVMPQTVEAINHAKAAGVPIIVAVNKIDKPQANPDRVKQELMEHELIPEEWGGDTIFVEISALMGLNIDELLEMIQLVSEMAELKAAKDGRPIGSVIEAQLDKSRGAMATILVQEGTLRVGDPIVVGNTFGRIRTMVDDQGRHIAEAGPSRPVEITGLNGAPEAGDRFVVFEDEKKARQVGQERAEQQLIEDRKSNNPLTLESLFENIQSQELKEVKVVLKADVRGSVEALKGSLEKIDVEGVRVNIIHTGVGAINETDVTLSTASQAIIIGFNVRPNAQAADLASKEGVSIKTYNVIYNAIDDIENAMKGLLDPVYEEEVIGYLQVRETYKVTKIGTIAGCYVNRGKITRDSGVRLIRNGVVIFEGELASLRRFNDDVREVTNGFECGLMIENYNDIKVDDEIEAYRMVEVKQN